MRTHALMYHDVLTGDPDASGYPGGGAARYKLSWDQFVAHLDAIGEAVSGPPDIFEDLAAGRAASPSWVITFDDGGASGLAAGEELARRQWRGHFFVTTDRTGTPGFLDTAGISELRRIGHVIGSHSVSHPSRMSSLSDAKLLEEWRTSVDVLSELLGESVRSASVPGGFYAKRIAAAAADAGISVLFTSEPVRTTHRVDTCLVVGRLAMKQYTPAKDAARIAAGHRVPWLREYTGWNIRKSAKALLGEGYENVRSRLLARAQREGSSS